MPVEFVDPVYLIVRAIDEHQFQIEGDGGFYRCSCRLNWRRHRDDDEARERFEEHRASAILAALDGCQVLVGSGLEYVLGLNKQLNEQLKKLKQDIQRVAWEMVEEPDTDAATRMRFAAKLNRLATDGG